MKLQSYHKHNIDSIFGRVSHKMFLIYLQQMDFR